MKKSLVFRALIMIILFLIPVFACAENNNSFLGTWTGASKEGIVFTVSVKNDNIWQCEAGPLLAKGTYALADDGMLLIQSAELGCHSWGWQLLPTLARLSDEMHDALIALHDADEECIDLLPFLRSNSILLQSDGDLQYGNAMLHRVPASVGSVQDYGSIFGLWTETMTRNASNLFDSILGTNNGQSSRIDRYYLYFAPDGTGQLIINKTFYTFTFTTDGQSIITNLFNNPLTFTEGKITLYLEDGIFTDFEKTADDTALSAQSIAGIWLSYNRDEYNAFYLDGHGRAFYIDIDNLDYISLNYLGTYFPLSDQVAIAFDDSTRYSDDYDGYILSLNQSIQVLTAIGSSALLNGETVIYPLEEEYPQLRSEDVIGAWVMTSDSKPQMFEYDMIQLAADGSAIISQLDKQTDYLSYQVAGEYVVLAHMDEYDRPDFSLRLYMADEFLRYNDWYEPVSYQKVHLSGLLRYSLNEKGEAIVSRNISIPWTQAELIVPTQIDGHPVTAIERDGFRNCDALESVQIPDTVTVLGEGCFSGCKSLKHIDLSTRLKALPDHAFSDCVALAKLPDLKNISDLGEYCFSGCTLLQQIELPEGITSIGDFAFAFCSRVKRLVVPEGVTELSKNILSGVYQVSIYVPRSVTSIRLSYADYKFYIYSDSPAAEWVNSLYYSGDLILSDFYAYRDEEGRTKLDHGEDQGFYYDLMSDHTVIITNWNWQDSAEELVIPAVLSGYPVTEIKDALFQNTSRVHSLVIEASLTSIPDSLCEGCANLCRVVLPDTIKRIGKHAFCNCKNLETVDLPEGLQEIGMRAFYGCSIPDIKLPESLIEINAFAFYSSCITQVYLGSKVANVGDNAFGWTLDLTKVVIQNPETVFGEKVFETSSVVNIVLPEGMTCIPAGLLEGASNLKEIMLPSTVLIIGDRAFKGCRELRVVQLPEGLREIGEEAFVGTYINELTFPESLTRIGNRAFQGVHAYFGTLTLGDALEWVGDEAFSSNTELRRIAITGTKTKFGRDVFSWSWISEITFPQSQWQIPQELFSGLHHLQSVILPDTITAIGEEAFASCENLERIQIPSSVSDIGANAFTDCPVLTIYGDEYSTAAYFAQERGIPFKILAADKLTLSVNANKLITGEFLTITVDAPGADQMKLCYIFYEGDGSADYGESGRIWNVNDKDGDQFVINISIDHAQKIGYYAMVSYDGQWSDRKSNIEIVEYVTNDSLAPIHFSCLDSIRMGESLLVQVDEVPGAELYAVLLYDAKYQQIAGAYSDKSGEIVLEDLYYCGTCNLIIHASKKGYTASSAVKTIVILSDLTEPPTGSITKIEMPVKLRDRVEFHVEMQGAEAFYYQYNTFSPEFIEAKDGQADITLEIRQLPGRIHFRAIIHGESTPYSEWIDLR